jgi:uncharacterized protein YdeI (YjbR/CyaY-like superfamily)
MLHVTSREAWRAWLAEHHDSESEVWLVFCKRHTGQARIPYDDAVEEALCFGWIDSIVKRIDDERYAQKFTPRRAQSNWSALNRQRVRQLIQDGRMTEAGLAKIAPGILDEEPPPAPGKQQLEVPNFVRQALEASPGAWERFQRLAPSHRRNYVLWVSDAKKAETRERRLRELIRRLKQGGSPGLA